MLRDLVQNRTINGWQDVLRKLFQIQIYSSKDQGALALSFNKDLSQASVKKNCQCIIYGAQTASINLDAGVLHADKQAHAPYGDEFRPKCLET
ncbi:hypothetical protein GOP47_0008395 [Adiantum capillus-veneris]|uniref:Uncharacterized protein n=1 Tax=Adiantum capillus-veneris TaxID=13818 RepID=A0A9D4ZKN3_ADICA|nr:hypothetical protein GOP47_0008395 [Adiantum capillus-veneris]